jgi:hypothetical protein
MAPNGAIRAITADQEALFLGAELTPPILAGKRRLSEMDVQNCFCEISKLFKLTHPELLAPGEKSEPKQGYYQDSRPMPAPFWPPKWEL